MPSEQIEDNRFDDGVRSGVEDREVMWECPVCGGIGCEACGDAGRDYGFSTESRRHYRSYRAEKRAEEAADVQR